MDKTQETQRDVGIDDFPEDLFVLYTAGTPGLHGLAYRFGHDFPPPGSTWLMVFDSRSEAEVAVALSDAPLAIEEITFDRAREHVKTCRTFAPEGKNPVGLALVDGNRKPHAFHWVV